MFFVVLSVSGIRVLNEGWHITKRTFFKENDQEEKYEEHLQKVRTNFSHFPKVFFL